MTDEQILKDVLEVVEFVKDQMVTKDEFEKLQLEVTDLRDTMVTKEEFKNLQFEVTDLRDTMVTKEEFKNLQFEVTDLRDTMVTKEEFNQKFSDFRNEIISHIDGFIVLHQKLDTELAALRAKYDRLESFIYQLAKQANVSLQD